MLESIVNHANANSGQYSGMPHTPLSVGGRIQVTRKSKGLTLEPVAKAAGISISALSQIEDGTTKQPKPETLFKIADALDVEPRWLVFGHLDPVAPSLSKLRLSDSGRFRIKHRNDKNNS